MDDKERQQHYSRALDEIYHLRALLARELVTIKYAFSFATTPKNVRRELMDAQGRIEDVLRQGAHRALVVRPSGEAKALLRRAGVPETLTVYSWESGTLFPGHPYE